MPKQKFKAPPEMDGIPERLRKAMEARGVGLNELGARIGVSPQSLGVRLSITGTSAAVFVLAAKELKIRVGWLLVREGEMEQEPTPSRGIVALEPAERPRKASKLARRSRN